MIIHERWAWAAIAGEARGVLTAAARTLPPSCWGVVDHTTGWTAASATPSSLPRSRRPSERPMGAVIGMLARWRATVGSSLCASRSRADLISVGGGGIVAIAARGARGAASAPRGTGGELRAVGGRPRRPRLFREAVENSRARIRPGQEAMDRFNKLLTTSPTPQSPTRSARCRDRERLARGRGPIIRRSRCGRTSRAGQSERKPTAGRCRRWFSRPRRS